ncbi:MAG: hypothetical protein KAT48_04655 [Bacteroidales bacterium]|nr:hypothetical protein [Bacteroidales bacterium]
METFVTVKKFVPDPAYTDHRRKYQISLNIESIDTPIRKIIECLNNLESCFTLQSCFGHFIYEGQNDPYNLEPLPISDTITRVEYKIAYLCLCIENSDLGRVLFEALSKITAIDPANIQFCCAEWFWKRQVNTYVLQVEPDRFKHKDRVKLDYREALHIEKTRNKFFVQIEKLLQTQQGKYQSG